MLPSPTKFSIEFFVPGRPVAKQSFRYRAGRSYQSARVINWQNAVGWSARNVYRDLPLECPVSVALEFRIPRKNEADIDNLAKGVLDGINGIVVKNDRQVIELTARKVYARADFGVKVTVCIAT